jgi:hypothetical protein
MDFEAAPIVKYIYNQTGELGGYPMVEILEKEMSKQERLGGKSSAKEIGLTKFENLVIPAGLVAFSNEYYAIGGSQDKPKIKVKQHEHMDNELFNKVFDLITKCPKNRSKQNTKKIIENIKNNITKRNTK